MKIIDEEIGAPKIHLLKEGIDSINSNEWFNSNDMEEIKSFLSKLSAQERNIIRKQLQNGSINRDELYIIENSSSNIQGFLIKSNDVWDLFRQLILSAIEDITTETKEKINDILNMPVDNSIIWTIWPRSK